MTLNTPVLLIAFNRPDCTQIVFNAIKKTKPGKLYFSVDGPRKENLIDEERCIRTREIAKQVDWPCELHTQFFDHNLGCGLGVSTAITWIFKHEDRAIILEDDCMPGTSFFFFCQELLEKYKLDKKVWMISGNNYTEEFHFNESYIFSSIAHHIWGWATWKRAWDHFDISREYYYSNQRIFKEGDQYTNKEQAIFFRDLYSRFYRNEQSVNTWDFQWIYVITNNSGLTIVPAKNLVSNIGVRGSHTVQKSEFQNRAYDPNFVLSNYPSVVEKNSEYDHLHFNNHWKKMARGSLFIRVVRKLRKIIFHGD